MDLSFIKEWRPDQVKLVVVEDGGTNIEHQENYYGGDRVSGTLPTGESVEIGYDGVVDLLCPIFYNDRDKAVAYVKTIKGMSGKQITDYTKGLVADKVISEMSCHRELWSILHDNGLYSANESNWNKQLK